jgi:hypothetical protein
VLVDSLVPPPELTLRPGDWGDRHLRSCELRNPVELVDITRRLH